MPEESEKPKGPITRRIEQNQMPPPETPEEATKRLKETPPTPADIVAGRIQGRPGIALPVEHKEEKPVA